MYHIFNFEMYSLVVKIAILVNSAVLLEIIIPALGCYTANVLDFFVEADPVNFFFEKKTFFLFKLLCFFL